MMQIDAIGVVLQKAILVNDEFLDRYYTFVLIIVYFNTCVPGRHGEMVLVFKKCINRHIYYQILLTLQTVIHIAKASSKMEELHYLDCICFGNYTFESALKAMYNFVITWARFISELPPLCNFSAGIKTRRPLFYLASINCLPDSTE